MLHGLIFISKIPNIYIYMISFVRNIIHFL